MQIAVCVKPVPDPKTINSISIDPVSKRIRREQGNVVINPLDRNALEVALTLKEKVGGEVAVFAMAPPSSVNVLRETLALGADKAYLLSDRNFGGSDTLATTNIIVAGLNHARKKMDYDLILFGAYSTDGGTAQVPTQVGEWLNLPNFHFVSKLDFQENIFDILCDYGDKLLNWQSSGPLVLSVTRDINKPRYTTIRGIIKAQNKEIVTLTELDIKLESQFVGLNGSPTKNGEIYPIDSTRNCTKISGTREEVVINLLNVLINNGMNISTKKLEGISCL